MRVNLTRIDKLTHHWLSLVTIFDLDQLLNMYHIKFAKRNYLTQIKQKTLCSIFWVIFPLHFWFFFCLCYFLRLQILQNNDMIFSWGKIKINNWRISIQIEWRHTKNSLKPTRIESEDNINGLLWQKNLDRTKKSISSEVNLSTKTDYGRVRHHLQTWMLHCTPMQSILEYTVDVFSPSVLWWQKHFMSE